MDDRTLDLSLYAKPAGNGMLDMELAVDGIACGACIGRIENAVKSLPGVTEARLNFTNRRLHVAWADGVAADLRKSCKHWKTAAITAIRSYRCVPKRQRPPKRAGSCAVWRLRALPP